MTTLLIGTDRGLFIYRADEQRSHWELSGPQFKGWKVTAAARDNGGRYFVGTTSWVYGAAIQYSDDLAEWDQAPQGPAYAASPEPEQSGATGPALTQIWRIHCSGSAYYAGVADAGLFRSLDRGRTWSPIESFNSHETRSAWMPGAGGLCAHSILVDRNDEQRIWCGVSAVGVFRSDDGGQSWRPKNKGVPVIIEDEKHCDIGFCVHALAMDPDDPSLLYRQDHKGMFRSRDGGDHWERNENGLPSGFGFPLTLDRPTRHLFCAPLESDEFRLPHEGRLRIYRSTDGGDSWAESGSGLDGEPVYASVMRGAMDGDHQSPGGVYFGTTSGDVFASCDGGEVWSRLPGRLPRIHCVAAFSD
ncbi:MAG: hypothetical protein QGG36_18950 [Pirellulaceae bacterium]|jgi:hypothetical protein|nr:hypothetical protein [Pirellulaceae bacterium]